MTRGLVGALAVVVVLLGAAAPARSSVGRAGQSTTATMQLVAQTPAVEPGGDFQARVRVSGATAGATLQLKVHDRATTRSAFQQTLDGKGFGPVLKTMNVTPQPDAAGSVPILIGTRADATGDPDRLLLRPGVYPIEVALRSANQTAATFTTYLVAMRGTDAGPPLGVALVVALGRSGAPALQPDGTMRLPDDEASAIAATTAVLAAHPTVPVTLAPVPERIAALANDAARKQLSAVVTGRQVLPTTFVPVDAQAWLSAALTDDLASELDVGTATLTEIMGAPTRGTWSSDEPISSATAGWLADRGVRNLIAPDTAFSSLDTRRFNTTLIQPFFVDGQTGMRAVAADTALASHLGKTGDPVLDASQFLADLAILDLDLPKATRLAVVQVPPTASPALIDAVLSGLQATRTLRAGTIDQLLGGVPTAGSRGEIDGSGTPLRRGLVAAGSESLGGFPSRLRTTQDDIATYRGTLDPGDTHADVLQRRALAAGDVGLTGDEQLARLDAVRAALRDDLAKVKAPPRQTITFTARDGVVSLAVRNTTGHAVHVVIRLDGPRLELPNYPDGVLPLTLSAEDETTRVQIDVRARSSGDAPLDVDIETPDGRLTLGRTRITVRSTALSGVGVVLSVGALAFLLVWWGRHTLDARRRGSRRPRHAVGSHGGDQH